MQALAEAIERVHVALRHAVLASMRDRDPESLRAGDDSQPGDTIYGIDRVAEDVLLGLLETELAPWLPVLVVAEGFPDVGLGAGVAVLPADADPATARHRVVVDPIDGTRPLMYGKRSAWILTGVAPARGTLRDVTVAVQTEIPPPKQTLADTLRAVRGEGASGVRVDLRTGERRPLELRPSTATTIAHGFGQVFRAVPGGRDLLAAIDEDVCSALLGAGVDGKALTFEDQYISTGGQLAELVTGHDRWVADLRPLLAPILLGRGHATPACCHPYDICTALIAQEAGVVLTGGDGSPLDAPLTLDADVAWIGYANADLAATVGPALHAAIARYLAPATDDHLLSRTTR